MVERYRSMTQSRLTVETTPKKVRGRPFKPGNSGRPPGSKNKSTQFIEQLMDNEAERMTKKMIELALDGDARALQFCLDRMLPRRSGRPIDLQLPSIEDPRDVIAALAAIANAVSDGRLTAEEVGHLAQFVERYAKAVNDYDLAPRIEALESQLKDLKP
jgi:hypothetical protein